MDYFSDVRADHEQHQQQQPKRGAGTASWNRTARGAAPSAGPGAPRPQQPQQQQQQHHHHQQQQYQKQQRQPQQPQQPQQPYYQQHQHLPPAPYAQPGTVATATAAQTPPRGAAAAAAAAAPAPAPPVEEDGVGDIPYEWKDKEAGGSGGRGELDVSVPSATLHRETVLGITTSAHVEYEIHILRLKDGDMRTVAKRYSELLEFYEELVRRGLVSEEKLRFPDKKLLPQDWFADATNPDSEFVMERRAELQLFFRYFMQVYPLLMEHPYVVQFLNLWTPDEELSGARGPGDTVDGLSDQFSEYINVAKEAAAAAEVTAKFDSVAGGTSNGGAPSSSSTASGPQRGAGGDAVGNPFEAPGDDPNPFAWSAPSSSAKQPEIRRYPIPTKSAAGAVARASETGDADGAKPSAGSADAGAGGGMSFLPAYDGSSNSGLDATRFGQAPSKPEPEKERQDLVDV